MTTIRKRSQENKKQQRMITFAAIGILVLAIIWVIMSGSATQAAVGTLPPEINTEEAYQKYQEGAFVLDVRTLEEWADHHAPDTTLIPLDELEARVNEVPRDQEIVVICRSGNRSQVGRDILLAAGFTDVTSVAGGLTGWKDAGFPTVSGP
jgi:hydroxyacylglutathione hydrolase